MLRVLSVIPHFTDVPSRVRIRRPAYLQHEPMTRLKYLPRLESFYSHASTASPISLPMLDD